jgi:tetratricopeptide (TPR) repeat protein
MPLAMVQPRLCSRIALIIGLALGSAGGRAQVIDMIDVAREGSNAVVSIRFATQIQYLRHAPLNRGDQIQVFFQFVGADESVLSTREDRRRSPPSDLVPRFDVTYVAPLGITQRRIDIKFATPVEFTLRPADNRTIALTIPLPPEVVRKVAPAPPSPPATAPRPGAPPAAAPAPSPAPAAEARPEVEEEAAAAMAQARDALRRNDFEAAVLALNRALNLPPNRQSQEAQEQIGVAREKLGELDKAKVEYELYLKLYPEGPGAARVRERLAALGAPSTIVAAPRPAVEREPGAPAYSAWGSVSQFYYGGQSRIQQTTTVTTPATGATTIETNQLSITDQSQVITTADVNGRWKQGPWDSRVVFRDAYTWNFLSGANNDNKLNAFYGETRYQPSNMLVRAGRQTGTSGGVLGRFDGGLFNWGFRPDWRLGLVAGQLVDSLPGVRQSFAGTSVDADNFLGNTSGQVFGIYQRVAGVTDRVGLGGEARYFDAARTAYGLFDYDPTFHAVNIASFQGTWQFPAGTALNILVDYRRTPTLQLTNVVLAEQTTDIAQLLRINGESALRNEAKAFTPISKVYLVGITQPFGGKWQFGLDVRLSNLSGTPATAVVPATPGTGNVYTYTAQLIGTSLTRFQDILVVNGSVLRGSQLDGIQAGIDYRFTPIALVSVEPSFKYYHQTDNLGTRLSRLTPAIRVIYQLRERFSLEGEYDLERTRTLGTSIDNLEYRHFFYLGWRWEF